MSLKLLACGGFLFPREEIKAPAERGYEMLTGKGGGTRRGNPYFRKAQGCVSRLRGRGNLCPWISGNLMTK